MRKRQRLVTALVLTLGLAALPAAAAGPRDRSPSAWQGLIGVWTWLTERLLVQTTSDQSSLIDPDGSTAAPDQGYVIDPNGSMAPPTLPRADESSYIDPDG